MAKLSDYVDQGSSTSEIKLLDSITTSATATYALTKGGVAYSPDSARNLIVSLNGITQAPQDAYTVSGSNIVFDSALTSADVIDYILVIGSAISIGTPSDGTVGTAQMNYPLGNFSSTGIDDNADSVAVTINSSEQVGIGTTNPAALLHINGSGDALRVTSTNEGVGGAQVDLLHFGASPADGDDHGSINFGGYYSGTTSSYGSAIRSSWADVSGRESCLKFFVRNGGTFYNHMQLNHLGHLLVGREDNSNHSSRAKIINGGVSGYEASIDFCYEDKDTVRAKINTDASGGALEFHTFDSDGFQERMRLLANGNLIVGDSSHSLAGRLTARVGSSGRGVTSSFAYGNGTTVGYWSEYTGSSGDAYHMYLRYNGSNVGLIWSNSSSTTYGESSDYRLKENVVPLENAIDRVKQIPVHRFNFIVSPDRTVDGFLAHEVGEFVPEAIIGEKDGMTTEEYEVTPEVLDEEGNVVEEAVMGTREVPQYQHIDKAKLVPLLTAAIKEQQTIIEDLQTRLSALEAN